MASKNKSKLTNPHLIEAANELNAELGLSPEIPTDTSNNKAINELRTGILEAASLIEPTDTLSVAALDIIATLYEEEKKDIPEAILQMAKPPTKQEGGASEGSEARKPKSGSGGSKVKLTTPVDNVLTAKQSWETLTRSVIRSAGDKGVPMVEVMEAVICEGDVDGTLSAIQREAERLGLPKAEYTVGRLRAHIKYRLSQHMLTIVW